MKVKLRDKRLKKYEAMVMQGMKSIFEKQESDVLDSIKETK